RLELEELRAGDVLERDGYSIVVLRVDHGTSSNGYALVESARPGRFDVEAAKTLGVPEGPFFGMLQRGESVRLASGEEVRPEEVLGPSRPGRKIVLSGDTRPAAAVLESAEGAAVLVHDATFADDERERADETGHTTATQAAELARAAGVEMLVLTHLSNRYFGPEIAREARTIFAETVVPKDFDIIDVPFPERGAPRLVKGGALGREEEARLGGDGSAGGGGRRHGGRGDADDPADGGDRVGAATGGGAAPGGAR
ncbi:MAG: ribonuclease Z, partial [Actinobacteria bacterium]|nr:ribonuclease Z [Actinomycetota bacterium]